MDHEYELVDEKDPGEEYKQEILSGAMEYSSCWNRSEEAGWFYSDIDEGESAGSFFVEDDE